MNESVSPGARLGFEGSGPNPFARATELACTSPHRGHVRLAVYDIAGHEVGLLVDDEQGAGRHALVWDGRGERRSKQSTGVWCARLEFAGGMKVGKVVIAR